VLKEEELPIGDAGQPGAEAPGRALLVLSRHGRLVLLPLLPVRRVRDEVVEGVPLVARIGERAPEADPIGVQAGGIVQEEVGLGDRVRLGVHLLPEEEDVGARR
jgi:hypothetical protein